MEDLLQRYLKHTDITDKADVLNFSNGRGAKVIFLGIGIHLLWSLC